VKEQLTLDELAILVNILNNLTATVQQTEQIILPLKSKLSRMGEELGKAEVIVVDSDNGAGEEAPKRQRKRRAIKKEV
jgi:hypothetical protein